MSLRIEELEKVGLADYYLSFTIFIRDFIDRNYPLGVEDFRAIINNATTDNLIQRQAVAKVLNVSMQIILERKAKENEGFIETLEQGIYVKPITIEEQQKDIQNCIQEMLGYLYAYQQTKDDGYKSL